MCTSLRLVKMCHTLRPDAVYAQHWPIGLKQHLTYNSAQTTGLPKLAHAATLRPVVKWSSARHMHCGCCALAAKPQQRTNPVSMACQKCVLLLHAQECPWCAHQVVRVRRG